MADSPTIEITTYWKKEELEAHNLLEELRKPNKLNDLIMTKVILIVEKLSRQCDARDVRGEIAILTELIQIRKSKEEYKAACLYG